MSYLNKQDSSQEPSESPFQVNWSTVGNAWRSLIETWGSLVAQRHWSWPTKGRWPDISDIGRQSIPRRHRLSRELTCEIRCAAGSQCSVSRMHIMLWQRTVYRDAPSKTISNAAQQSTRSRRAIIARDKPSAHKDRAAEVQSADYTSMNEGDCSVTRQRFSGNVSFWVTSQ